MNRTISCGAALQAAAAFTPPGQWRTEARRGLKARPTIVFAVLFATAVSAQDARGIVETSQNKTRSKSEHYEGTLEVIDAKSRITTKRWTFDRVGSYGDSRAILRFTSPPEVKGVALLIVNHPERSSDQWMWIPALERDRRVSMQDRRTRFFGTDFSFEDLEERDVGQFDYKLQGDDTVDGAACWKIESRPKQSKSSQYSTVILWFRKDNYVLAKLEGYDKDKLTRRINYTDIANVDSIWTSRKLEVLDAGRKSRTVLTLTKLQYNVPMKEENFTVEALRRAP